VEKAGIDPTATAHSGRLATISDQTRIEASTSVLSTTGADSKSAARPTRPKRQNEANRESGCLSTTSFKQFEAYRRDARKSDGPQAAGAVEQARMPAAACRARSAPLRVK
jgi:hypothetical protein